METVCFDLNLSLSNFHELTAEAQAQEQINKQTKKLELASNNWTATSFQNAIIELSILAPQLKAAHKGGELLHPNHGRVCWNANCTQNFCGAGD